MSVHANPSDWATQAAFWTSSDGLATASVSLTSHTDDRGADGWAYYLSVSVPDGVGFGHTFADPRELIFTPGDPTSTEVLETLSRFVGAWHEAVEYGVPTYGQSENADLFPKVCERFLAYAEEFQCDLMTEVEE